MFSTMLVPSQRIQESLWTYRWLKKKNTSISSSSPRRRPLHLNDPELAKRGLMVTIRLHQHSMVDMSCQSKRKVQRSPDAVTITFWKICIFNTVNWSDDSCNHCWSPFSANRKFSKKSSRNRRRSSVACDVD